ncbi:PapB/FocB family fimbrial expression transcriptional regulator [Citrobacter sp. A316]|uniref:PapB/FocB family fimbrial expression transcriptional regulator n=1 Tax=Citrobacter sp. A316 TaxID=1639132 RepID=UPI001118D731|nr:PapB/FocB family fimbrial expression transcriptional regulator [Citrobacter sp. A316]
MHVNHINKISNLDMELGVAVTKRDSRLISGTVPEDVFWLLIELSAIRSEKIINALKGYFVEGKSRKYLCDEFRVNNGYLSTSIARVERAHAVVKGLLSLYKFHDV